MILEWLKEKDASLLELEEKVDHFLEYEKDIYLIYDESLSEHNGYFTEVATCLCIALSTESKKPLHGNISRAIQRLVVKAHEYGHYLDMMENWEGSFHAYANEADMLERELNAWRYGIEFLFEIGFGELGHEGWDALFNLAIKPLTSYYYHHHREKGYHHITPMLKELSEERATNYLGRLLVSKTKEEEVLVEV